MRIRWTLAAAQDLRSISDYLREHHPHYRLPTLRKLYETIRSLKDSPHRGWPGTEADTRELIFAPLSYRNTELCSACATNRAASSANKNRSPTNRSAAAFTRAT